MLKFLNYRISLRKTRSFNGGKRSFNANSPGNNLSKIIGSPFSL